MNTFLTTTHLSEILEKSETEPVIIFKYSSSCYSSSVLSNEITKALEKNTITAPVYLVTVQTMPVLSKKIEEKFAIKHESPQIIILNKGLVTYSAQHKNIRIQDFRYDNIKQ